MNLGTSYRHTKGTWADAMYGLVTKVGGSLLPSVGQRTILGGIGSSSARSDVADVFGVLMRGWYKRRVALIAELQVE